MAEKTLSNLERVFEVQKDLQAPVKDEWISWKPGTAWNAGREGNFAIYFPYIRQSLYEDRLDTVLGATNWRLEFDEKESLTICRLIMTLPGESIAIREGVGAHSSRNKEETGKAYDEEHGARTKAFRDACKRAGICGRDLDGCQTIPVLINVEYADNDGKPKRFSPVSPLTRDMIRFPGQMSDGEAVTPPPPAGRTSASAGTRPDTAPDDPTKIDEIIWPYGKHKGKKLSELASAYLEWCMENMDQFKPDDQKFNQKWYDAVCVALAAKEDKEDDQ